MPSGLDLDESNSYLYIADSFNHRIQRWNPGATSGVTVAGSTGLSGASATLLNRPFDIILSSNETYFYVVDRDNHRIQRFDIN